MRNVIRAGRKDSDHYREGITLEEAENMMSGEAVGEFVSCYGTLSVPNDRVLVPDDATIQRVIDGFNASKQMQALKLRAELQRTDPIYRGRKYMFVNYVLFRNRKDVGHDIDFEF